MAHRRQDIDAAVSLVSMMIGLQQYHSVFHTPCNEIFNNECSDCDSNVIIIGVKLHDYVR